MSMLNRSRDLILSIKDSYLRDGALGVLSNAYIKINNLNVAEQIINSISDKMIRFQILRDLASKIASLGNIEKAINITKSIENEEYRYTALKSIVTALVGRGAIEDAISVACSPLASDFKDELLKVIAYRLVDTENTELISSIIDKISDPVIKASTMGILVYLYGNHGDLNSALNASRKALEILRSTRDTIYIEEEKGAYVKDIIMTIKKLISSESIAINLARANLTNESKQVIKDIINTIEKISERDYRIDALRSIIRYASQSDVLVNIDEIVTFAYSEISKTDNVFAKSQTLKEIAIYLWKSGKRDEAIRMINESIQNALLLNESFHRDALLKEIALDCIKIGNYEAVDDIISKMGSNMTQINILCEVAKLSYKRGDMERANKSINDAIEISGKIIEPIWRAKALGGILIVLAEMRRCDMILSLLEEFTKVMEQIDKDYSKATILSETASEILTRIKK